MEMSNALDQKNSNRRKRKHDDGGFNEGDNHPFKRADNRSEQDRSVCITQISVPPEKGTSSITTHTTHIKHPQPSITNTQSLTINNGKDRTRSEECIMSKRLLRSKTINSEPTKCRSKLRGKDRTEDNRRERESYLIVDAVTENVSRVRKSNESHNVVDDSSALQMNEHKSPTDLCVESFGQNRCKPADLRLCPLPTIAWADASDVWRLMCRKDEKALLDRDPEMLERHPGIQARMRAILLDWLMEVCEVYKLHRETYYLAVDYLDRYLTANLKLPKTRLQLIGITCLFTAAKVEEIYPPKMSEFAYVTDGACTEDDIIKQELMLMLGLNWSINPVTIIGWLSVYMQLKSSNRTPPNNLLKQSGKKNLRLEAASFVYPQFSTLEFILATKILDLCTLDVEMAHFQYSVVAAAVIALTINRTTALRVSGLEWQTIKPCVKWMEPFFEVIRANSVNIFLPEMDEQVQPSFGLGHLSSKINTDDSYIVQTHSTSLALFDDALKYRETNISKTIKHKKKTSSAIEGVNNLNNLVATVSPLTPPDSNRKSNISNLNTPLLSNVNGN